MPGRSSLGLVVFTLVSAGVYRCLAPCSSQVSTLCPSPGLHEHRLVASPSQHTQVVLIPLLLSHFRTHISMRVRLTLCRG